MLAALVAAIPVAIDMVGGEPDSGDGPPAAASPKLASCQRTTLPLPTGALSAEVSGADPTGRCVVGNATEKLDDTSGRTWGVVWDDGEPLAVPATGASTTALAANHSGVVVGWGDDDEPRKRQFFWVYREGTVTELPLPAGYAAMPFVAVNAEGDIAGTASRGATSVALLWPGGEPARMRVLSAPGNAAATGIADDGTVVGWLDDASVPYAWDPTGEGRPLPTPERSTGTGAFAARGEWAVGTATLDERDIAVRWNLRTGEMTAFADFRGFASVASGGDLLVPLPTVDDPRPLVVVGGKPVALPVQEGHPASLSSINDTGTQVAGHVVTDDGFAAAVWRC